MWLKLTDNDAAFLVELLDRELKEALHLDDIGLRKLRSIFDELNKPEDPDDDRFRKAVATDDELECDPDAVVSMSDDGAFVMTWTYVTNEEAGIELED